MQLRGRNHRRMAALIFAAPLGAALLMSTSALAQDPPRPLASLKTVPKPDIPNIGEFILNEGWAIKLGKALFWDMQVGTDKKQACATCHFAAGADPRVKNQISPGLNAGDLTFQVVGPNGTLTGSHYPFTRFTNILDRNTMAIDKNDVTSSQGVLLGKYKGISSTNTDNCGFVADPTFNVAGVNTRRVEPRNTPTAINALFNFRNFLDGRANNNFNGVNPFGQRDVNAKVLKKNAGGGVDAVAVVIPHSSLASQAVGPPLSFFEMSCAGRVWQQLGKRLLKSTVVPLGLQKVHLKDSELGGSLSRQSLATPANGITKSYSDLIKLAFQPVWWSSTQVLSLPNGTGGTGTFSQMEANFSLFFGLAVQAYERTLVADDSPVDKFLDGNAGALTSQQQLGMALFQSKGKCINCHSGAELTNASVRNVENQRLEAMIMGDGGCRVYDDGFYNIGARPTDDDIGVGGQDPFGNPLSETLMSKLGLLPGVPFPDVPGCAEPNVMGAIKAPSLRNVELTGPYFHNGGKATLWHVVDFYDRGGDFADQNIANLDPDIGPIGFNDTEKNALVSFLIGLTDERVRFQKPPFDHPALCFPAGEVGNEVNVTETSAGNKKARDINQCISAVGSSGYASPLPTFLGLNSFLAEDPAP